ncbi:MAG: hypothetical protein J7J96_07920 [Sulfurimonas sp.]|nr:hypothetical protein [Sulfurimonas sp.]
MNLKINDTNLTTIKESFLEIAEQILNYYILNVNGNQYRIKNIEFYYYNENKHPDQNSHSLKYKRAKERQILNAQWYLHKISINKKYNYKSLDYTFGDSINYGGILIKEVVKLNYNTKINFSQSKFIDELIDKLQPKTKEDFLEMIENKNKINFIYKENIPKYNILRWTRKGLTNNDKFKNMEYAFKIEDL